MMNNILEMLIRRSRGVQPTPPTPSVPTDYVFYAPLATDLDDHSISARTCTEDGWDAESISLETKDGVPSVYIPTYAKLTYPIGDVVVGDNARTFSIWYYPTFEDEGYIPLYGVGGEVSDELFEIALNNSYMVSFGGRYDDVFSDSPLHAGWNHMAVTFDGTTVKVYHDGVFVASGDLPLDTATSNIVIGGRPWEEWSQNQGWYSDAYIYNRELSSSEIMMLYNSHGDASDSSSSISDSSSSISDSSSSTSVVVPSDYIWYTPFTKDYKEMTSGIVGVPNQPNAFSIATDNSKFGTGYLAARKTNSDTYGIEYANTATYMGLSAGTITISLWLRAPDWANYSQLLGGTRPYDGANGFVLFNDFPSNPSLDFRSRTNTSRKSSYVNVDSDWHHWLFTRTAEGAWTWYKDGVVATSGTGDTGSINGTTQNMKIGGGTNWNKQAYFDLAHFRVYDRVLDSSEIYSLYHEDFSDASDSDMSDSSSSVSDSSSSISDSSSSISDLVFRAPFTTDLSEIVGNRTATPTDSGAADVTITTKDGKSCVYVPSNARLLYSPCGDVPLGNTSKSMAIWVNLNFANSRWNGFLGVGENSQYKLFLLASNNSWQVAYGGSYNDIDTDTSQLHSGWNHVAVTYDTTAIRLYHDGVLVKTNQQSTKVNTAETNICVGGRPAASDNYCESAWFSDARIYSRALTDAEILSIYQEGL